MVSPDPRTKTVVRNPARTLEIEESDSKPRDYEFSVSFDGRYYSIRKYPVSQGMVPSWNQEAFSPIEPVPDDSDGSHKVSDAGDYDCQVVRMLKKATSFVLASRKGSTYSEYASPSRSAAALLNGLFEHPERKDLVSVNGGMR